MIITSTTRINGIGLRGKRRSGKDTTYRQLKTISPVFERIAFADALKADLLEAFDQSRGWLERNKSRPIVRCTMQAWGQRAKDLWGQDYWIKRMESKIKDVLVHGKIPVITDVRFPQEVEYCKSAGFVVVQLIGPNDEENTPESRDISETALDGVESDFVIDNSKYNPYDLRKQVNDVIKHLYVSSDFQRRVNSV